MTNLIPNAAGIHLPERYVFQFILQKYVRVWRQYDPCCPKAAVICPASKGRVVAHISSKVAWPLCKEF
jgi:hypothetical protein